MRFARLITNHQVIHAHDIGWERLTNGRLIASAEAEGFQAVITVDKNFRFQQNLKGRAISLTTLDTRLTTLEMIAPLANTVLGALKNLMPGTSIVLSPSNPEGPEEAQDESKIVE
jgi:hypothetical protein